MKFFTQGLFLAGFAALLNATSIFAQEAPVVSVPFDGTEAFGHILHSFGLKAVANIEDIATLPGDKTLIIVFGALEDIGELSTESLTRFRKRGGAVLLSSRISRLAAAVTSSTARSKTSSFVRDGRVAPLSLRTNWMAAARISSSLADGSKFARVLILRHMRTRNPA